jgi:outer membrane protein assembly factor BamB
MLVRWRLDDGSTAYVGGEFTSVRPSGSPLGTGEVARNHAYAVNVQTGELLPWDPDTNNTVQSIAVSGQTVYLGGTFGTVGDKTHARIAAVDAATGTPIQTFKAKTNGSVNALAIGPAGLYMGGAFRRPTRPRRTTWPRSTWPPAAWCPAGRRARTRR